jgi:hypothetical protein
MNSMNRYRAKSSMPMRNLVLRSFFSALLLCFAAGAVPTALHAQSSSAQMSDDDLQVSATVPLPRAMRPGWVPIQLSVVNLTNRSLQRDIVFQTGNNWDIKSESTLHVQLAAGEEQAIDLFLPYFGSRFGESVLMRMQGPDGQSREEIHRVESSSSNRNSAPVLVVTSAGWDQVDSFQSQTIHSSRDRQSASGLHTSTASLSTTAAGVVAEDLVPDWRAYSTLTAVAINLDAPLPDRAAMEALIQWTSLGGGLAFFGSRPERAAELLQSAGVSLQERLRLPSNGAEVYRQGFGRIGIYPAGSFRDGVDLNELGTLPGGVFPDVFLVLPPALPGVGLPPLSLLTFVLIAVALILGPIQFQQMKKRDAKPWRFLQTTPVLGIGFAVLVLIASLLSQGLGVRESVQSVTWLDQGRRTASTIAARTSFSGSLFEQRQRFGAEALLVPSPSVANSMGDASFSVDLNGGAQLGGAFLPTRIPTSSCLVAHTSARSGLRLEYENEALFAINDLDVALHKLRLVDADGNSFEPEEPNAKIAAGQRVRMLATDKLFDVRLREIASGDPIEIHSGLTLVEDQGIGLNSQQLRHLPAILPPRSWMAEVEKSPFLPDGGVSRSEEHAVHLILGLLEEGS